MAGDTPAEAVRSLVDRVQRAISCLTRAVVDVRGGYWPSDEPHALTLGAGDPVPIQAAQGLHLSVRLRYRVIQAEPPRGPWQTTTVAYEYRLSDRDDREIVAYHWHPEGMSHVTTPHLHLGPAAEVGWRPLARAHLPTGRIALEEVLRLAIEAFGARALRPDWDAVLRTPWR